MQWKTFDQCYRRHYNGPQPRNRLELEQRVEEALWDINLQDCEKLKNCLANASSNCVSS